MKTKRKRRVHMHKYSAIRNFLIRYFGDIPVRDAKKDLRVFAGPEDIIGAVRGDPECCVFANACKRLYHSRKVVFMRSVAYVELIQDDATHVVERFTVTPKMKALIAEFDSTGNAAPGGYLLTAPPAGSTLDAKRESDQRRRDKLGSNEQKRRKDRYRRAALKGTAVEGTPAQEKWKVIGERFGTGLIHFHRQKAQEKAEE